MHLEARKIHLIEEVLKVKSDVVLSKLEKVLNSHDAIEKLPSIYDFVGIISKNEADKMKLAIAETCENIGL